MGMEKDWELNNHRFRAYIKRNDWRRFFVEFFHGVNGLCIDCPTDINQMEYYEKLYRNAKEKYEWKENTMEARNELLRLSKQPYYHYNEYLAVVFLKGKEPTKQTIVDCVNLIFSTNFTDMVIDNKTENTQIESVSK